MTSNKYFRIVGLAVLVGRLALAQAPGASSGHGHSGARLDHMGAVLGLTDAQKTQAKSIFDAEHLAAQPLMQQIRTLRQSLRSAVVGGNADIDQLTGQLGSLTGQLAAIHTKALAQFYTILTADQQTKAQAIIDQLGAGPFRGRARP